MGAEQAAWPEPWLGLTTPRIGWDGADILGQSVIQASIEFYTAANLRSVVYRFQVGSIGNKGVVFS